MSMNDFSAADVVLINTVKDNIKFKLTEFNMTVMKRGKHLTQSYFVSGGCIASLLQGTTPNDWDIYFYSKELAEPIIDLFTNDPSYKNEVAVFEEKYRDVTDNAGKPLITENAITLKNGLQLITKHYGTPDEVRSTFDFVHCKPYYDTLNDKLYISREQFDCCKNKFLKMTKSDVAQHRIDKFQRRGYLLL